MEKRYGKFFLPAALALFFLAAFASYRPALPGPFFLDDGAHLGDNVNIRIKSLEPGALWDAAFKSPSPNRPLPMLTFALDYYRAGLSTSQFRTVNISLHAFSAFLLFLLFCRILEAKVLLGRYSQHRRTMAFFAAFLWMLSPVQTQSVSYLVQRMNILAALFYLAAFLAYIRARESARPGLGAAWFALCGIFALLAVCSKENAAVLPFFLLVFEWFFFQKLDFSWLKRRGLIWFVLCLLFLGLAGLTAMGLNPVKTLAGPYAVRDFTMMERLLTQARVLVHYISLLILPLPSRLVFDYDFTLSKGLFSPLSTFFSALFIFAACLSPIFLAKKYRLAAFAILWFFGNLAIESSVIGLEIVFEHRLYLPSMFFFLSLVLVFFKLIPRSGAAVAVCTALCFAYGAGTHLRNQTWAGELAMWQDNVKKSPKKARPRYSLAIALYREGRLTEALDEAQKAVKLGPKDTSAWFNLGRIYEHPDIARLPDAVAAYGKAIETGAHDYMPHINRAFVQARLGRFTEAWTSLAPALANTPDDPLVQLTAGRILLYEEKPLEALRHLAIAQECAPDMALVHESAGVAFSQLYRFRQASQSFEKAAQADPQSPSIFINWGHALYRQGLYKMARDRYATAANLDENNVNTLITLAIMENLTGRPLEAVAVYMRAAAADTEGPLGQTAQKRALRLKARYESARNSALQVTKQLEINLKNPALLVELGVARLRMGDFAGADKAYAEAEKLAPNVSEIKNNQGLCAMRQEKYEAALDYFKKALALDPKSVSAQYNMMCLHSRINDRDNAILWLKRLLDGGFSDYVLISRDTDLENLRETKYYKELVERGGPVAPAFPDPES